MSELKRGRDVGGRRTVSTFHTKSQADVCDKGSLLRY